MEIIITILVLIIAILLLLMSWQTSIIIHQSKLITQLVNKINYE